MEILTVLRCIFGPNLVILAWTADELWGGQAQNEVKFDFQVKFDLEGHGRSPPKTIGTLTKVFCTFVPNLVILAWTSGELSCGQARDWHTHTHGHTDTQTQATTIPEGQNWPRVKMIHKDENFIFLKYIIDMCYVSYHINIWCDIWHVMYMGWTSGVLTITCNSVLDVINIQCLIDRTSMDYQLIEAEWRIYALAN